MTCVARSARAPSPAMAVGADRRRPRARRREPGAPRRTHAQDLVVLSGTALVAPRTGRRGGRGVPRAGASCWAWRLGDVVVLDGPVTVSGQVSGSVIAVNGPVRISASASVRGDVLGGETVRRSATAPRSRATSGSRWRSRLRGSLSVLGELLGPLAIACSVLLAGAGAPPGRPRGADRVATAARSAPLTSIAWGVVFGDRASAVGAWRCR